jgi:hypothetical protein
MARSSLARTHYSNNLMLLHDALYSTRIFVQVSGPAIRASAVSKQFVNCCDLSRARPPLVPLRRCVVGAEPDPPFAYDAGSAANHVAPSLDVAAPR